MVSLLISIIFLILMLGAFLMAISFTLINNWEVFNSSKIYPHIKMKYETFMEIYSTIPDSFKINYYNNDDYTDNYDANGYDKREIKDIYYCPYGKDISGIINFTFIDYLKFIRYFNKERKKKKREKELNSQIQCVNKMQEEISQKVKASQEEVNNACMVCTEHIMAIKKPIDESVEPIESIENKYNSIYNDDNREAYNIIQNTIRNNIYSGVFRKKEKE